jgi:hypothetical protein
MNKFLLSITCCMLLISCGSVMKLRVDSLNMPAFRATYLYGVGNVIETEAAISFLTSGDFEKRIRENLDQLKTRIDTSGNVPEEDLDELIRDIETTSLSKLSNVYTKVQELLEAGTALKSNTDKGAMPLYDSKYAEFNIAILELRKLGIYYDQLSAKYSQSQNEAFAKSLQRLASTIDAVTSPFGESIVNKPLASVVTALPEQYWKKYKTDINLSAAAGEINAQNIGDVKNYTNKKTNRINTTTARTKWGNSDIAIKMAGPGEFIVKGVRVDADEAVRNSFKVVSQGIKYMAYAAGVPVVEAPNSPRKSITPLLDSLSQKGIDLESTKNVYSQATDAFLQVLASVAADLNATTAPRGTTPEEIRKAALARVKTAYEVYKTTINNQK